MAAVVSSVLCSVFVVVSSTMCGRFNLVSYPDQLSETIGIPITAPVVPRYNIAPSQPIAAVRLASNRRQSELTHFAWGFLPVWSDDPTRYYINARLETAGEKPSFRDAFKRRRCLIPATGFYEWKKTPQGKKPFHIYPRDRKVFLMAGIWGYWSAPDGTEVQTAAILTEPAKGFMKQIHNRMPVILPKPQWQRWLSTPAIPPHDTWSEFAAIEVSSLVNKPTNTGPDCIESVENPLSYQA
ncbi:MAG: SOS response-associated peptidase [Cyanobacteria bacterium P01_H01_bin.15]